MKTEQQKNKLRAQLLQKRNALSKEQQADYSQKICHQVITSNCFKKAEKIAFYMPVKGEANPLALQENNNKSFYLPVLSSQQAFHLIFVKINANTRYKNNKYTIPEPIYKEKDILPAMQLDLVIMPLVAVDKAGNRMGMGGGYYDRTFAFKQNKKINQPQLLGFAYDFQLIPSLSPASWDIPLDYIATNNTFIQCRF